MANLPLSFQARVLEREPRVSAVGAPTSLPRSPTRSPDRPTAGLRAAALVGSRYPLNRPWREVRGGERQSARSHRRGYVTPEGARKHYDAARP
jgi:hypothetical protein